MQPVLCQRCDRMVHTGLLARTQTTEQRLELAGIHHGVQKELGALVLTVCVCVRVCVCARACARVRVCVFVCDVQKCIRLCVWVCISMRPREGRQ